MGWPNLRLIGLLIWRWLHERRVIFTLRLVVVFVISMKGQGTFQHSGCAEKNVAHFVNFLGDLLCWIRQPRAKIGAISSAGRGRKEHKGSHGQSASGVRKSFHDRRSFRCDGENRCRVKPICALDGRTLELIQEFLNGTADVFLKFGVTLRCGRTLEHARTFTLRWRGALRTLRTHVFP